VRGPPRPSTGRADGRVARSLMLHFGVKLCPDRKRKPSILIAVDALDDLPAIEELAVELATVGGCEIVAAFGTSFIDRYTAPEPRAIIWPAKGTGMIEIDLTRCSIVTA
jgi:hypothetical protein